MLYVLRSSKFYFLTTFLFHCDNRRAGADKIVDFMNNFIKVLVSFELFLPQGYSNISKTEKYYIFNKN